MEGLDRGKFALYFFGTAIGAFACPVTLVFLSPNISEDGLYGISGLVGLIAFGITMWAISERLNNLNQSQWLILMTFIPVINLGFLIYLLFTPAPVLTYTPSPNVRLEKVEGYCPKCGRPRVEGHQFCAKCGNQFAE